MFELNDEKIRRIDWEKQWHVLLVVSDRPRVLELKI